MKELAKFKIYMLFWKGITKAFIWISICRHPLKTSKLISILTVIFIFCLHTVLYCFHWKHKQLEGVLSVHGGSLSYEGIGQIQNVYVILKGENVGFHLDINLSASFENVLSYTQPYIHIYFSLHTVLYCFHWEHRQLE